jgi:hypothetical protein
MASDGIKLVFHFPVQLIVPPRFWGKRRVRMVCGQLSRGWPYERFILAGRHSATNRVYTADSLWPHTAPISTGSVLKFRTSFRKTGYPIRNTDSLSRRSSARRTLSTGEFVKCRMGCDLDQPFRRFVTYTQIYDHVLRLS